MALTQSAARWQLGIPQDKPVVLIVGGGEGMGPLAQVVQAIAQKNIDMHICVIVGRNQSLYDDLQHADLPKPIQVKGFVDNMEVWMRAADILVTKAGPNTLVRSLYLWFANCALYGSARSGRGQYHACCK